MNPTIAALLLAVLSPPQEATGKPWIDMEYGPTLTATLEVGRGNIAYKGVAIRLDEGPGGISQGRAFMVFDTDTLRAAAGWTGLGFINWNNIAMDGAHQVHAKIVGSVLFSNPDEAGWARRGSFKEARILGRNKRPYGPLPRDWAHWKGLTLSGNRVVLSYSIGETSVLESPGLEGSAITRTFNMGPRAVEMILQAAYRRGSRAQIQSGGVAHFAPGGGGTPTFDGSTALEVADSGEFDLLEADFSIYARIKTEEGGTIFSKGPAKGKWKPNGKTFFIRGGRLCYDIGWVGVVTTARRVDDDRWHDVAMTWDHKTSRIRMYIDGRQAKLAGEKDELRPAGKVEGHVVRIGYTSPNFPGPRSAFVGSISEVRFYTRVLKPAEMADLPKTKTDADLIGRWVTGELKAKKIKDASGKGHEATRVETSGSPIAVKAPAVAVVGAPEGTEWIAEEDGHLRLRIPAGREPIRFKLLHAGVEELPELLKATKPAADLAPLTRGGPARWSKTVTTKPVRVGAADGAFVVESLGTPMKNPYRAWMRLGGFDFFKDGRRAAVCTWNGDVWIVDGLAKVLGELTWRRIATGLFQPLGLKVVDERIYVLGRDQITRLHDLNGDGETDYYENFNNDAQVTEHFHEFAMALQTDAAGDFYYLKGGRHALDSVVPQHGTLLKVSKDGSKTTILANGFRAPNGLCLGPDGVFITSDQEGHWTPANRINWVKPGGFYGYRWSYPRGELPKDYVKPLCWIKSEFDRSPAAQLWVPRGTWGPLAGGLLNLSYGTGRIDLVLRDEVDGAVQGGVTRLPIAVTPTGVMRGRFHPSHGDLYACGLFGWSSDRTLPGGFYRVHYTGKPMHVPVRLHATRRGIMIRFSEPVDATRAADARRYSITRWNYLYRQNYGSDDYRLSDGKIGRDKLAVASARVSKDARSVFLEIEGMKPCMQMRISLRLKTAEGARLANEIYHTIHALADAGPILKKFE